jgi:hypothetical protein
MPSFGTLTTARQARHERMRAARMRLLDLVM